MTMLPNKSHDEAQRHSIEAEVRLRQGDLESAFDLFSQAAELEVRAFWEVPPEHERTRGFLAVSAAALLFKASQLDDAERFVLRLLSDAELPTFAIEELRRIIQAVWHAKWMETSATRLTPNSIVVSLRGKAIGVGQAPLALVLDKIAGVNSLLFRITEWLGGFDFRTRGPPPDAVRKLCQPVVSEPSGGSFRFEIQIAESIQPELFPVRRVNPHDIASRLLDLIRIISPGALRIESNALESAVPDRRYREAMLMLVRNLTPDGSRIREVEFASQVGVEPSAAVLYPAARSRIDEHLRRDRNPAGLTTVLGTLRALDLDRTYVEISDDSGNRTRLNIQHEILDDVVGPMVNRRVVVTARWNRPRNSLTLIDMELDTESEEPRQN